MPDDPQPAAALMATLAQVCHLWHDVALTHATLWVHIDVHDEAGAVVALERAGAQPLTVTFRLPDAEHDAAARAAPGTRTRLFKEVFESHISRIDTLVMPLLPELPATQFASLATSLRRLFFIEPSPSLISTEIAHAPLLPHSAFPVLTTLVCRAPLWEPLTHLCVPTLTTLELFRNNPPAMEDMDGPDEDYTTGLAELLDALLRMPRLEHLAVELSEEPFDVLDPIALPKLRSLRVRAATSVCAALLRCVQLPPDVTLDVWCLCGDSGPEECDGLALPRVLTDAFANPAQFARRFTPVRTAALCTRALAHSLRGWRAVHELAAADADPPPDVQIRFATCAAEADFRTLLGTMPIGEVQSARIQDLLRGHGEPAIDCGKAFCRAPRLERVVLEGVHPCVAWELLLDTPATHAVRYNVPPEYEYEEDLPTDEWRAEEAVEHWRHTFKSSNHAFDDLHTMIEQRLRETFELDTQAKIFGIEYQNWGHLGDSAISLDEMLQALPEAALLETVL